MDWTDEQIAALIEEHRPAVRAVARRMARDDAECADLEQETLLRALLSLEELRDASRFRPWIQSIARNVALGRVRARQRGRQRDDEWYRETAGGGSPELQEAEAGLVELALQQMPEGDAGLLRRHYLTGIDGRGIALELGITEAAVRQRMRRARERLKEAIMDMVREDRDSAGQLVDRMLQSAVKLTQEGRYQQAVSKLLETFNQFPGSLTAIARLPREVRESLRDSWGEVFQYVPPLQEPEGASHEELEELAGQLPEAERDGLMGTIEDIARRLEVSPAWVYRWWTEGLPHLRDEGGVVRFRLDVVRRWLTDRGIKMPRKALGAESYFLAKGIRSGLEDGVISPEDAEMMAEVFIHREQAALYRHGSFFSIGELAPGCPPAAARELEATARVLSDVHRAAVGMREAWTPNCGFVGAFPYDAEGRRHVATELRGLVAKLQQAATSLDAVADKLVSES